MGTVKAALSHAEARLLAAGVANAGREVVWMLAHLTGRSAGAVHVRSSDVLEADLQTRFEALVTRRAAREPLQYLLGTEEFMGAPFLVTPAVLIPRPDTETLVQESVRLLRADAHVADIGTGSGAIAVSIARLLPEARVVATDISHDALAIAARNALAQGVAERIRFCQGDLLTPLQDQRFDGILCNPPYISESELMDLMPEVRDWEPRVALTPGPDGLAVYRRLAADGVQLLNPDGFLGVEVGHTQADAVAELFRAAGLTVSVHRDAAGIERAVVGRK